MTRQEDIRGWRALSDRIGNTSQRRSRTSCHHLAKVTFSLFRKLRKWHVHLFLTPGPTEQMTAPVWLMALCSGIGVLVLSCSEMTHRFPSQSLSVQQPRKSSSLHAKTHASALVLFSKGHALATAGTCRVNRSFSCAGAFSEARHTHSSRTRHQWNWLCL